MESLLSPARGQHCNAMMFICRPRRPIEYRYDQIESANLELKPKFSYAPLIWTLSLQNHSRSEV